MRDSERENGPNWRTLSAKTSRSSSICCSYLVVRLGRVYRECRVFVTNQSKWPSFAAPVPIDNGLWWNRSLTTHNRPIKRWPHSTFRFYGRIRCCLIDIVFLFFFCCFLFLLRRRFIRCKKKDVSDESASTSRRNPRPIESFSERPRLTSQAILAKQKQQPCLIFISWYRNYKCRKNVQQPRHIDVLFFKPIRFRWDFI